MRVSPVAWWLDTLAETLEEAEKTTLPTQNHSEEVKGAKAVAHAIFTLRTRAGSGWQKIVSDVCELYYPGGMKKLLKGAYLMKYVWVPCLSRSKLQPDPKASRMP